MNQLLRTIAISAALTTGVQSEEAKPDATSAFWRWFEPRSSEFARVFGPENQAAAGDDERIRDKIHMRAREISQKLTEVHPRFGLFIGPWEDHVALTVTVYGQSEFFDAVDRFIHAAPSIKGWKFIALKPPYMPKFVTTGDSSSNLVTFRVSELKYAKSRNASGEVEVVVYVPVRQFDSIDRSVSLARSPEQELRSHIGEMVGERPSSTISATVKIAPLDENTPESALPLTAIHSDMVKEPTR